MAAERILVTGGASGIGWAICRALAAAGHAVAVADIDPQVHDRARKLGPQHVALQTDLTEAGEAGTLPARAAEALGGLDVIVNNAGMTDSSGRTLMDLPDEAFDRIVALNLTAVQQICAAAPGVLSTGGRIVNLASGASFRPLALRGPYSATKAGIVALTQRLARDFAPQGIAVSAVAPGYTLTPLVQALADQGRVDLDKVAAAIPLGRLARPEDIADSVVFAASAEGRVLAGLTVLVDGGGSAGPAHGSTMTAPGSPRPVVVPVPTGPASYTLRHIRQVAQSLADDTVALLFVFDAPQDAEQATAVAAGQMLARTLALEWAPSGRRVNALTWHGIPGPDRDALCAFLTGPRAGYITAQAITAGPLTGAD